MQLNTAAQFEHFSNFNHLNKTDITKDSSKNNNLYCLTVLRELPQLKLINVLINLSEYLTNLLD